MSQLTSTTTQRPTTSPEQDLNRSGANVSPTAQAAEQVWRAIEEGQRNISLSDRSPLPEGKMRELNQALATLLQRTDNSTAVAVNDTFNVSTIQALRILENQLGLQSSPQNLSFQDYQRIIQAASQANPAPSASPVSPSAAPSPSVLPHSQPNSARPTNPDLDPVARFEKVQRGQETIKLGDQSYAVLQVAPLINSAIERRLISGPPVEVPADRRFTPEIASRLSDLLGSYSIDSSGRLQQRPGSTTSSPATVIDSRVAYTLALVTGNGAIPAEDFTRLQASRSVFTQFRQYQGPWADQPYGRSGSISSSGCAPTSVATVLGMNGIQVDPQQMADLSARNGFRIPGSGTSWDFFRFAADRHGLNYSNVGRSLSAIDAQLALGRPVIVSVEGMPFSGGGHITVVYGKDPNTGNYLLADPGPRQVNSASPATLRNNLVNAWTIYNQDRPGVAWRPEDRG